MIKRLLLAVVIVALLGGAVACGEGEDETIEIGVVMYLSGDLAPMGARMLNGARLAVEEINAARKEQVEKNMPTEVFSIFWILKKAAAPKPEGVAREMKEVLESYPHWARSEKHERKVKQALYRNLVKAGLKDAERLTELCQQVMTALKGEAE